jgi:hypothetical protein
MSAQAEGPAAHGHKASYCNVPQALSRAPALPFHTCLARNAHRIRGESGPVFAAAVVDLGYHAQSDG